MVLKPFGLQSVQVRFGSNSRYPSDEPLSFGATGSILTSPTQYQKPFMEWRRALGLPATFMVSNGIDYKRFVSQFFIVAVNMSVYGADVNALSPIDENLQLCFKSSSEFFDFNSMKSIIFNINYMF